MILDFVLAELSGTIDIRCRVIYLFTNGFILVIHIYLFHNVSSFFSSFFLASF